MNDYFIPLQWSATSALTGGFFSPPDSAPAIEELERKISLSRPSSANKDSAPVTFAVATKTVQVYWHIIRSGTGQCCIDSACRMLTAC